MKLSFSIPSRSSSSKPKSAKPYQTNPDDGDDEAPQKQFVTEFDSSKPQIISKRPALTIAPIPNSYQPHKRMKNLHALPSLQTSSDGQLQFETETLGDSLPDSSNVSYGLNIRSRSTAASSANDDDKSQQPSASTEDVLLQKLKVDLRQLPEDRGFEEFEDMPVESFAKALLSGYGWREGQGVGRNAKEDVKVKQYHKRTGMAGLGFLDLPTSAPPPPPPAAAANSDSSNRSSAVQGARKDKGDQKALVGKHVRVIGGARRDVVGLKGTVVDSLGSNRLVLKVAKTGERVILKASDITDLGSREEEKCLKELEHLRSGKVKVKNSGNGREISKRDDRERGVAWLRSHIRVRVISKDLKGGRLYRKKGEVVDVVGPYICDVSMDESRELVEKVDQDVLETALPRRGGPVLILYGKHKGVYGNLEERDLDREVGVVRDSSTQELLHVKLEQIAEYVGDPSYIGY